jgi:hypothetical protein
MARYDAGWRDRPPHRPYDQSFGFHRDAEGRRGYGGDERAGFGNNQAWQGGGSALRGGAEVWGEGGGVYGPARYGLGPYHERLRNWKRPDEEIREDVEEALFYDTWVDAEAITVEVQDGVVTLRGDLPNYEEIRYANDDAWDVDGVRGVRSELAVRND